MFVNKTQLYCVRIFYRVDDGLYEHNTCVNLFTNLYNINFETLTNYYIIIATSQH